MKTTYKILSVIFTIVLILGTVSVGMSAYAASSDVMGDYDFTIQNVYKDIDWSNVNTYKGAPYEATPTSKSTK